MSEASTSLSETPQSMARAALEAMAQTLSPEAFAGISFSATLRPGTLSMPGTQARIPPTRGPSIALPMLEEALPRMSLASSPSAAQHGDLTLTRTLGEGGMGIVWLAHQRSLSRDVAVKRLKVAKPEDGGSSGSSALLAEARATGALEHPNIVPVHALGLDAEGSPVLVMKRIEGDSLEALIRDPSHAAWPELERRHGDRQAAYVQILMQVADALEFAHARGIIHRDVKPENVMVGHFGEVYLVDWGIALRRDQPEAEEEFTSIVGTPSFMAPEMTCGDTRDVDAQTDVYLLGATLHTTLTGEGRHTGETLFKVVLAAMRSEPIAYEAKHGELGELANRATHVDKRERPASARAFREALADFLRHRASTRLADEARTRLDAITGTSPITPEQLATPEATRALTESRFGFTQALRDWSENTRAREGLEQTLRWMIEAELFRRSPEAAAAHAAELSTRDVALEQRIETLRAELAQGRALEDHARSEARELDPQRTARQRVWIVGVLILVTIVLVALGWTSEQASGGERVMSEVLTYDAVLISFVALLILTLRKRLFVNRLGRQITMALTFVVLAPGISDVFVWLRGGHPSEAGAASMLSMACVLAGAGIGVDYQFLLSAAAFLGGAIVCAIWPSLTVPAVGAASILALSVGFGDSIRQARAAKRTT